MLTYKANTLKVAAKATEAGRSRLSPHRIEWDISGSCLNPVPVQLIGTKGGPLSAKYPDLRYGDISLQANLKTPCRRCKHCRNYRAKVWRQRSENETSQASRTWLVTLTYSQMLQDHSRNLAILNSAATGTDWDTLDVETQFKLHAQEQSPDLTCWLKRIRKRSGSPLRYILIAEAHKTGLPHYHALVHEQSATQPILHRHYGFGQNDLTSWPHGHGHARLVTDAKDAVYVCKYLSKSALVRIRASKAYGTVALEPSHHVKLDQRTSSFSALSSASEASPL